MKKMILFLVVFLLTGMTINTFGQTSPDYIFGDGNGAGWGWVTGTEGTAGLGSTYKWQFTATATTDHYFKFGEISSGAEGSGFWTNADGSNLQYLGAGVMWYFANMGGGGAIYLAITTGNYYVVKTRKDPVNSNCNFAVFDNGAVAPVTITGVTNTTDATNLYVDVQLSGAKGANEKAWVRYTTDNWATSNTIEASSDQTGDKWRATIVKSSSIFEYYVYTTIQQILAPAEAAADFYAVNYANNGGLNYKANLVNKLNYAFSSAAGSWEYLADATAFTWTTTVANDEEYSNATNIGFNFYYCGTEYTQFQVSTNGFLRFGTDLASATATDALNGALRKVIAPLWDDLGVSATATDITYKLSGSAPNRVLTVEWKNVKWNKAAATANAEFQIKLYEHNGKFEYIYGTMGTPNVGVASIGINDATLSGVWSTFISVNVGASGTNFHTSMAYPFNAISVAPSSTQKLTFTPQSIVPLNGSSYTVGGDSPTWTTLSQMAQALNFNGVAGPVVINVRPNTYDDIIHLLNISGTSDSNTITIQKESGTVTLSPRYGSRNGSGSGTADQVVILLGTDYTTFNGLDILHNSSNTSGTWQFEFGYFLANFSGTDGPQYNTVKNFKITGSTLAPNPHNFRAIRTSGGGYTGVTAQSGAVSYNTFKNFKIDSTAIAVYISGMNGTYPDIDNLITCDPDYAGGNTLGYNDIGNMTYSTTAAGLRGFFFDAQDGATVEKCEIRNLYNTNTTSTNDVVGIGTFTVNTSKRYTFQNNIIHGIRGAGTTTQVVYGIWLTSGTYVIVKNNKVYDMQAGTATTGTARGILHNIASTVPNNVYLVGNMIYDLRNPGYTAVVGATAYGIRGIELNSADSVWVINNTIYLDAATTQTTNYNGTVALYSATSGNSDLTIYNNIIVNASSVSDHASSKAVAFGIPATGIGARIVSSDNNLFYSGAADTKHLLLYNGTNSILTIPELQVNLGSPRELNSLSVNPSFVSNIAPYDFHILNTSFIPYGQGKPLVINNGPSITPDIDNNARSTEIANGPVCIGADEYTATGTATTTVTGSYGDLNTTTYTGVDGKIVATITWYNGTGIAPTGATVTYTPGTRATDNSIYRKFTITESGDGDAGWYADVNLYYNSSTELRGFTESSLRINQNSGGGWGVVATTINTTNHSGLINVSSFSDFSFDNGASPLPIELASLSAVPSGQKVDLKWSTKTEVNSYQFVIERSLSSHSLWEKVGEVNASGNSNSQKEYSFTDKNLAEGKYSYRLKMIDNDGTFEYSQVVEVEVDVPNSFTLSQNYPNPFNPVTQIQYQLPVNSQVKLVIYTITGELVTTLVDENQVAGSYTVPFTANALASGTYIYRLVAGDFVATKKMVVLK